MLAALLCPLLFFFLFLSPSVSPEPLIFTTYGETIRLSCPVGAGQRWHRVSWEDALGKFVGTGNSLKLRDVTIRDAGLYKCRKLRYGRPGSVPVTVVYSVRLVVLPHPGAPQVAPPIPPDMLSSPTSAQTPPVPQTITLPRNRSLPPRRSTRQRLQYVYTSRPDTIRRGSRYRSPINTNTPYPRRRRIQIRPRPHTYPPRPQYRPRPYTYLTRPQYRPSPYTRRPRPRYTLRPRKYLPRLQFRPSLYTNAPRPGYTLPPLNYQPRLQYRQSPYTHRPRPRYTLQPRKYLPRSMYRPSPYTNAARPQPTYQPQTLPPLRPQRRRGPGSPTNGSSCMEGEAKCDIWRGQEPLRTCISQSWICDGESDCGNGWDERECYPGGPCQSLSFRCSADGENIPTAYRCDRDRDCSNGADEQGCLAATFLSSQLSLFGLPGQYFRLQCLARGLPRPRLTWNGKNGQETPGERIFESCSGESSGDVLRVNSTLDVRVPANGQTVRFECHLAQHGSIIGSQLFVVSARP